MDRARQPPDDWDSLPAMEKSLFRYIWRHSKRDQLIVCAVVLASLPFYFASLDLPRRIVNEAIQGKAFAHGNDDRAVPPARPRAAGLARRRPCPALRGLPGRPARRCCSACRACSCSSSSSTAPSSTGSTSPRACSASACCGGCASTCSAWCCASRRRRLRNGQVVRDRDHHQGRGRADRRLHRRRVHHAGLPRQAGRDRPRLHHGAERLARR